MNREMYNSTVAQTTIQPLTSLIVDNVTSINEANSIEYVVVPLDIVMATIYGLICVVGLTGHGLVLSAVFGNNKEGDQNSAVTDVYVASLSLADTTFLVGLPFIIVTGLVKRWLFGSALCKVFYDRFTSS